MSEMTSEGAIAALSAANSSESGHEMGTAAPAAAPAPASDPTNIPSYSETVNQPAKPVAPVNGGGHPAYQEYLNEVPEGFRPVVRGAFEKWDAKVREQLQQVHSQYEPYKQFTDAQVSPEQLNESMQLYRLLATDPRMLYDNMAKHYGFAGEQGQGAGAEEEYEEYDLSENGEQAPQFDITQHPQFQQMQAQQEAIIRGMQEKVQADSAREQEQWLEQQIGHAGKYLEGKGIPVDDGAWNYILGTAAGYNQSMNNGGKAFAKAVDDYVSVVQHVRSQPRAGANAPSVIPPSGGVPMGKPSSELTPQERKETALSLLRMANRE